MHLLAVAAPGDLARAHGRLLGARQREVVRVVGEPQPEADEPWLETSASCLPSGETAASSTPLPGVSMSVRKRPLFQSAVSVENAGLSFLTRQRTMPNELGPSGSLTPTPRIERPSGAQWIARVTANDGSSRQLDVGPVAA